MKLRNRTILAVLSVLLIVLAAGTAHARDLSIFIDSDGSDGIAEFPASVYQQDLPVTITIQLQNLNFKEFVQFENDLAANVPGINSVTRVEFKENSGVLNVASELSSRELSDYFLSTQFTDFSFEIIEFSEDHLTLNFPDSSRANTGVDQTAYVRTDDRPIVTVVAGGSPFYAGIDSRAVRDIGNYLSRLRFINYVPTVQSAPFYGGITDWIQPYNQSVDPETGGQIPGPDLIVEINFEDIDFDFYYSPPVFDNETGRIITAQSWTKNASVEVSLRIIDNRTGQTVYSRSANKNTSDFSTFRPGLDSDQSMIDRCWRVLQEWMYIDLLDFFYSSFSEPRYVMGRHPSQEDRALINLSYSDGLYVEMPMRLYIPGENGSWEELCKVTVKEVYGTYSVIELQDKWYEYFEFGEGSNLVWPVHPDG